VVEGFWKGDCDLRSAVDEIYDTSARLPGSKVGDILVYVGRNELKGVDRRGCGPAGGQWDNQDGKAAAGSVKDCGVGQGCTLPGWDFLRLVGWQYRKINCSRLPHPHTLRFRVRIISMHGPQWNNTRIILTDARYPAIDAFYLVRTGGN